MLNTFKSKGMPKVNFITLLRGTFGKFIEILNEPRFLEISYGNYEDKPIIKDLKPFDYKKIALDLNKQNTEELIRAYVKRRAEKDGLLLTENQLNYDTEQAYINYKNAGFIDLNNNLKIGVEEGLKDTINS